MSRLALAAVILALPSIAAAQAPGEAAPVPLAPAHGPFAAVVTATPPKPVELQKKFGVSARVVSMGLSDGLTTGAYGGAGLAASYRINRRWELVLALDGLDNPDAGTRLHSTSLEARFHVFPLRAWDLYALVGVGAVHEMSDDEHAHDDGESRGRASLGVGLQRRFRAWSVGAELHSVGVGPREQAMDTAPRSTITPTTDEGLTGGQLTVAATLFF